MFVTTFKGGLMMVLVAGLALAGAAGLLYQAQAGEDPKGQQPLKAKDQKAKEEPPSRPGLDQQLIQGSWRAKQVDGMGKSTRGSALPQEWVISADKIVVHFKDGTEAEEWTYKLDLTSNPRSIDLKMTKGVKAGGTAKGIFEIRDGTLRISFNGDGDRPSDFSAAALGDSRFARIVVLDKAPPKEDKWSYSDALKLRQAELDLLAAEEQVQVAKAKLAEAQAHSQLRKQALENLKEKRGQVVEKYRVEAARRAAAVARAKYEQAAEDTVAAARALRRADTPAEKTRAEAKLDHALVLVDAAAADVARAEADVARAAALEELDQLEKAKPKR